MEILKMIDSNTGAMTEDFILQANVSNLIVVYPKDIYGNILTDMDNLIFTAMLSDSTYIITSKCILFELL
jgi:hypothetical protein